MVAPETVTIFVFLMTYVCAHKVVAESINTIVRSTKNVLLLIAWWLRPVGSHSLRSLLGGFALSGSHSLRSLLGGFALSGSHSLCSLL